MNRKELSDRMKLCVTGKLPAGITDQNVEFFAQGEEVFALTGKNMIKSEDWPEELIEAIEADMEKNPVAIVCLVDAKIEGRLEMAVQYIKCRYSALDNEPDMIAGIMQDTEYVDCNLRGVCPYEGRLCELLKAPFGTLTHREIEVLRLILDGLADKEIADRLGISPLTVPVHTRNLRTKTGAKSKTDLARFAFQKNLI